MSFVGRTGPFNRVGSSRNPGLPARDYANLTHLVFIDTVLLPMLEDLVTATVTDESMAVSNEVSDRMVRDVNRLATRVLRQGRRFIPLLNLLGGGESAIPEVLSEVALRLMTREKFREDLVRLLADCPESEDEILRYLHVALRRILIDMIRDPARGIVPAQGFAGVRVRVPASVAAIGIWAVWVFDRFVRHGDSETSACMLLKNVLASDAQATCDFEKVAGSYKGPLGLGSRDMATEDVARKQATLLGNALKHAQDLRLNSASLETLVEQVWNICDREGVFAVPHVEGGDAIDNLDDNHEPRAHERCGDHSLLALTWTLYLQHMLVFLAVRATNRNLAELAKAIVRLIAPDLRPSEMSLLIVRATFQELGNPNIHAIQKYANANGIKGTAAYEFKQKMCPMMARLQLAIEAAPTVIDLLRQRGFFDKHARLDRQKTNGALVQLVETLDAARIRDAAHALVGVLCGSADDRERRRLSQHDITSEIEALRADVRAFVDDQSREPCEQVHE